MSYLNKPTKDIKGSGFDWRLQRRGIDNTGFDAQRLNGADREYIKKILNNITGLGVNSVNGETGNVTLTTDDITEGSNEYHTSERAQDAVGAALSDSKTVNMNYNDGANEISAEFNQGIQFLLMGA